MTVGRGVFWKKTTTDDCWRLDMTYLAKQVNFLFEQSLPISWSSSWGRHCSIGIDICPPSRLRFRYTTTNKTTDDARNSDYYVHIDSTPCNYGGCRWWFLCPSCHRRCRILYLAPGSDYFACRICHNLTYTSQQESKSMWWAMSRAINDLPKWEEKYYRAKSPRKKAILKRKIDKVYGGMQNIIGRGRRNRRKSK